MFVPLVTTLHPLRAHMAAGILEEHGILAWVSGDVTSSGYGTVTTGGCQVMVEEEDAEEAARVLNAPAPPLPAEAEEGAREVVPERERLSLGRAVATGLVQGAVYLPLLCAVLMLIQLVMLALINPRGGNHLATHSSAPPTAVFSALLISAVAGAVLGVTIGVVSWLFSNYRRGGVGGTVFVTAVAVILTAPGLFLALLLGQFSQIFELLVFYP